MLSFNRKKTIGKQPQFISPLMLKNNFNSNLKIENDFTKYLEVPAMESYFFEKEEITCNEY